ncbi:conserved hypothetical protein [Ricinus communis]|uniref:Uncharacterized protein n=1 Tax=Ricinus communis TaxID=3988 RepID=B9SUM5_RICCO|nr:conserved hypothetical protein [Ricinus communis]
MLLFVCFIRAIVVIALSTAALMEIFIRRGGSRGVNRGSASRVSLGSASEGHHEVIDLSEGTPVLYGPAPPFLLHLAGSARLLVLLPLTNSLLSLVFPRGRQVVTWRCSKNRS